MKRQISPHTRLWTGAILVAEGVWSMVNGMTVSHRTTGVICLLIGTILVMEWSIVSDRLRRKK